MSRTLAKKLAQVKPGTLFVGVDLGLDRNVAVIINEGGRRLAKLSFPHNQDGYAYFRRRLRKLQRHQQGNVGIPPVLAALTGFCFSDIMGCMYKREGTSHRGGQ